MARLQKKMDKLQLIENNKIQNSRGGEVYYLCKMLKIQQGGWLWHSLRKMELKAGRKIRMPKQALERKPEKQDKLKIST